MINLVFLILGLTPSFIWLYFFLKKDNLPEPKAMVLRVFIWGALVTIPVLLIELGVSTWLKTTDWSPGAVFALEWFLGIAFTEEVMKYLVVRGKALKNSAFDEPVDAMIYLIIAALGFAAVENISILFSIEKEKLLLSQTLEMAAVISLLRFFGATILHALCSGVVGYFVAKSYFNVKKRFQIIFSGILIATILHGLFDVFIIGIENAEAQNYRQLVLFFFLAIAVLLFLMGMFVLSAFKKLKKMKSVCQI